MIRFCVKAKNISGVLRNRSKTGCCKIMSSGTRRKLELEKVSSNASEHKSQEFFDVCQTERHAAQIGAHGGTVRQRVS